MKFTMLFLVVAIPLLPACSGFNRQNETVTEIPAHTTTTRGQAPAGQ